jgi:Ca2+-transporting ATPase
MSREPAAAAEAEDVVARLGTDEATGLTEEEAARRLKLYGPNLVVAHHPQVRFVPPSLPLPVSFLLP